jgi:hypothetical protein
MERRMLEKHPSLIDEETKKKIEAEKKKKKD